MAMREISLPRKIARFLVEVAGYQWVIRGLVREGLFEAHLVELICEGELNITVNKELRQNMREAIALFLDRDIERVKPVRADLFLI